MFIWNKRTLGRTAEEKNPRMKDGKKVLGMRNGKPCHTRSWTTRPDNPPFTDKILATKLPSNRSNPVPDRYDDSTDLDEHIDGYVFQLTLFTTDGHIYYKVFPTSLKGAALSWFTRLPLGSIDSFATLKDKFLAYFATSKPHQMTSVALVNIRQEKGESLKAFMARFTKVSLIIWGLIHELAMDRLTTALRPGPFADSLTMQPPTSIDDLRCRATQYMQAEELQLV